MTLHVDAGALSVCQEPFPAPTVRVAVQVLWNTLIGVIPLGGKNSQQIQGAVQKQIKTYQKLMEAFTSTSRAEQALINHVQVCPLHQLLGPCDRF